MDKPTSFTAHERQFLWPVALAINLIVPVMFGLLVTEHGGRIGMVAGIVLLWYLGHRICVINDALGRALVVGGFIVATTQLIPVLQFVSGIVSVGSVVALRLGTAADDEHSEGMTELGGLIATVMTGLALMAVAALCGAIVGWLTAGRLRSKPVSGSHLHDRQLDG